jgi:hypothetical protein
LDKGIVQTFGDGPQVFLAGIAGLFAGAAGKRNKKYS